LGARERSVDDPGVPAHAVDPMYGEVTGLQLLRDRVGPPPREPGRGPRVATRPEEILLRRDRELGRSEDEPVRERGFDRLDGRRTHDLARARQRAVTASRDDRAIAARLEVAQPLRDLGRVALRRPPRAELQIEPLGELRQLELDMPGDRVAQLAERPGS